MYKKIDCIVPKIKLLLIAFAGILFLASCQKEFSDENGTGSGQQPTTAVFTFAGAPSSCTGAVVGGLYTTGAALSASNTVKVSVNVATIGTYTISTATVDGIIFSAAGSFNATGVQTVTLIGTGTPTAAGTFNFTTGATGCGFTIVVIPLGPLAVGTLTCASITNAGVYTQGIALDATNTITIPVTVTTAGTYIVTTLPTNGCVFSAAGTLAAGSQTITLTGAGTPTSAGPTNFSVVFGTSTCNFSITFLPGVTPSTDYLRCNIDGVATTFNVNLIGAPAAAPIGSGFSIDGDETSASNTADLSLNLVNLTAAIGTGVYNLVSITPPSTIFCQPIYNDADSWSQTSTSPSTEFVVNVTAKTANRITGTFSGILHNSSNPATIKTFTNGEFSVPY
jgi:hypothetical protein